SPGRNGDAGEREPQNKLVDVLSARAIDAFAHRIADVAEHEQVADRGTGKARNVLGLSGHEPIGKALGDLLAGLRRLNRRVDLTDKRGVDRNTALARQLDKALGKLDVAGGERRLDLAPRDRRREAAIKADVGKLYRIILRGEQSGGLPPVRQERNP